MDAHAAAKNAILIVEFAKAVLAILMGVAGGVLPAFRAARMPMTPALRDA